MIRQEIRISFILCSIISIFLLAFTTYRAFAIGITFDEGTSYIKLVRTSFADIVSYKVINANNHLLNTLLMKLFSHFLGISEFVLRLQSIIAHIFYLIFSYHIVKRLGTNVLIVCGFILLTCNPYLLDFFSLARGYGLATSFMMGSICFLFKVLDNPLDKSSIFLSFLLASFAVLSNFSMLLFFIALLIIYNIIMIVNSNKNFNGVTLYSRNRIPLFVIVVLTMIIFIPLKKLKESGALYFGGTTGFWQDTVKSIIETSLYGQSYTNYMCVVLNYFLITTVLLISLASIIYLVKGGFMKVNSLFIISFLLLLITCLVSILQHLLINGHFLTDRMTIFFIPLFFLSVLFCMDNIRQQIPFKNLINLLVILLTLPFFIHTLKSANLVSTYNWKFDAQTKEMLSDLKTEIIADNKELKNIKLGISWYFVSSVNYYRITKNLNWLNFIVQPGYIEPQFLPKGCEFSDKGINGEYDYYYVIGADVDSLKLQGRTVIKKYEISNSVLFKK